MASPLTYTALDDMQDAVDLLRLNFDTGKKGYDVYLSFTDSLNFSM